MPRPPRADTDAGPCPGFDRPTVSSRRRSAVRLIVLTLLIAGLAAGTPTSPAAAAPVLTESEVTFRGDGVELSGTVLAPAGGGRRPGIVLVTGAGPGPRDDHRAEAEAFARAGVVTLIYDKRTRGYSLTERDYTVLANDALAGVRLLRGRTDVDPTQVGLWGHSEGTWVGEDAASRSSDVAFLVLLGASGVPPLQQQVWSTGESIRYAGAGGSLADRLPAAIYGLLTTAGGFAEPYFDPVPRLARIQIPVLAIWGEHDTSSPPAESAAILARAVRGNGNANVTLRTLAGGQHDGRTTTDGFDEGAEFAAPYPDMVGTWVTSREPGPDDPAPRQARPSTPVTPTPLWLQLTAPALMLLAALAYLLIAALRRFRGRTRPPLRAPARLLGVAGPLAVLGPLTYGFVGIIGTQDVGPVLAGRAVVWSVMQVLAAAVVAATIWLLAGLWRARQSVGPTDRARLSLLAASGVAFVPWALEWGLLL
ncbi:alpha/beta hydrolase family protein [Pseudonocardia endophytica]|uniref:Peptidase S9 prolyl oligopeptidase catalytic domain-containing protein n=1 Tax=Pseudonocardia endophytica TaxID=401976 RepID=A0A4R1HNL0_PSEEN|nr:alpha/beta hydrolase [Pseudonocardia endophytica]TCK21960.1 hypothetical protein EV378_5957 [Pseudonocardia endophytica]